MRSLRLGATLLFCAVLLIGIGGPTAHAQPDSVRAKILEAKGFSPTHSPRGAVWRAAALPGWGQFYNHQYYKIPFVYAGLAGGGYAIVRMNRRYILYRHANLYKIGENRASQGETETNPYGHFQNDYDEVTSRVGGDLSGDQLRQVRDKYRRWRDLSILGTGLFYALTIIDAYVSAHLLAFNVGSELTLDVRPTGSASVPHTAAVRRSSRGGAVRVTPKGPGLRLRVQF